ncbi:MAG: RagB/SusD family nutrient uptake outer membrane protein, partial [Candidatus Nitrosocosmicus sp.]
GKPSELYHARDKATDVYHFIETQMDSAITMMSTNPTVYRFNKWSGLAFKSRAMLYAASIATYGSVQLDGVLGIPKSESQHYWEAARDAAKLLMDSGTYELYNQDADKVKNYHDLFFDESASNHERIFVDAFTYPIKTYHFDLFTAPFSHRGGEGYGGRYDPTFDLVSNYEYINNSNGSLKLNDLNGNRIVYSNPADLFEDKDPRFFASVLFPGSPWMGTTLKIYGNIIQGGVETGGTGPDGLSQPESSSTGFYLSKWADPAPPRPITYNSTDVDYMIIRYAEVLLTYAEAQLELGDVAEATKYVNMIRERAGLKDFVGPVTMDEYRHERRIELAFEGNRYWDLKRWRVFADIFNNKNFYALWPIFNKDNNTYTFEKEKLPSDKYTRTFTTKLYYSQIGSGIISSNPLIIENPGY